MKSAGDCFAQKRVVVRHIVVPAAVARSVPGTAAHGLWHEDSPVVWQDCTAELKHHIVRRSAQKEGSTVTPTIEPSPETASTTASANHELRLGPAAFAADTTIAYGEARDASVCMPNWAFAHLNISYPDSLPEDSRVGWGEGGAFYMYIYEYICLTDY